jgi:hypothetical protein
MVPKRFVIAKVKDEAAGFITTHAGKNVPRGRIVKYRSRNVVKLFSFLSNKFGACYWMNVYDESGIQITNFSVNNPPVSHV